MQAKLLCVGDMHLGRRPARIPAELGVAAEELGPRAAWRRVVALAIAERVDAVLLAGDVVEASNRYFEAFGALERGVRELESARIRVIGVAGNHDVEVLPRLADEIAGFHLLGRGGKWEALPIERDGRTLARIVGWSFPERVVRHSPLASFDLVLDSDVPNIGLLHCELGASAGNYAPVARRELEARSLDAWLLGHIHAPSLAPNLESGARPIGYLGSLSALDPTETGAHGPWMVRAGPDAPLAFEQHAIAPLAWESLDVSIEELALDAREPELDLVKSAIVRAIGERHARLEAAGCRAAAIGVRVTITGRTPHGASLRRMVREPDFTELRRRLGEIECFVDRVTVDTRPDLDLEAFARMDTPPGLLARRILALRSDSTSREDAGLVQSARRRLERVASQPAFDVQSLDRVPLDDAALRSRLARAGERVLEDLLAEAEAAS